MEYWLELIKEKIERDRFRKKLQELFNNALSD